MMDCKKSCEQCEHCLYVDSRRVELCSALGVDPDTGWRDAMDAMGRRLMPEGMEWPRFEDGEPVRIGDEFAERIYGNPCKVGHFAINKHSFLIFDEEDVNDCEAIDHGTYKRVKRPAPKVLDADGVEIREGDTVWTTFNLRRLTVANPDNGEYLSVSCKGEDGKGYRCHPTDLTHRAPVLAADGKPLREGETVWVTEDIPFNAPLERGDEVTVKHVYSLNIEVEDKVGNSWIVSSRHLTHEPPDSWERLEEDVTLAVEKYRERHGIKKHDGMTWPQLVREDLVRRARALAERGER